MKPTIGFIGQGWIGKHYADDFEARGFTVVRYALEEPYRENKEKIAECDIVFIAVPTPTTEKGFDDSVVRAVLPLVGEGKIAVIKSTLVPRTTETLQELFPKIIVLHSPEFLREKHAVEDASHPERTIIGMPVTDEAHETAVQAVLAVLPKAPYEKVMSAREAELVKYAGNVFLSMKVVYANLLAETAKAYGVPYEAIQEAVGKDSRIGPSHMRVEFASGHTEKMGRGAGGHCFIKDLEAFRRLYKETKDGKGSLLLDALVRKNNQLLTESGKDIDLLESVYGKNHDVLP